MAISSKKTRILGLSAAVFAVGAAVAVAQSPNPLLQGVDQQPTSALPYANPGLAVAPLAAFERGLTALAAQDVAGARTARDDLGDDTLDSHILTWAIALRGGAQATSADILLARKNLNGWPGETSLQRNLERALAREGVAPAAAIEIMGDAPALTLSGAKVQARARLEAGDRIGAAAALSPIWRYSRLDAPDENKVIEEFGAVIPQADHRFRMERMLYADRTEPAGRLAALAGAAELAQAWTAVIRGEKDAQAKLDAVPAAQRSAGYDFARAKMLRRQDKREAAAEILINGPKIRTELVDPAAWWDERRILARQMFDAGKPELAYRLAASHAGDTPANQIEAEFHAGWYALRGLEKPDIAAYHFARIAELAEGPISNARAHYWLGRAADAGAHADAKAQYALAAKHGATFYGQLAAEKLGRHEINTELPVPSGADRVTFPQREAVRALTRLTDAGFPQFANILYMALADELTSPGELALLAAIAQERGNHYLALKVGKVAVQNGVDVGALSHPIGAIPADADISGSGKALAYAIARQESEFNVGAVSKVGALGLLQLMPGTAAEIAKKAGVEYSKQRLTTDAGYNAELGAAFLGQQLDRFDGSYVLTFIGYNAGPRRAQEWIKRYGDPRGKDLDTVVDWIERIPFSETRSYVQRVMENYQVYKMRLTGKVDVAGDLRFGRR